ncbi:hypothetical protein SIAM614_02531 [Stappia aggregata IAM 12614]|uniref:Multidrug resistance efflux pump n=1 Tax=Roseibium aggregatum (strain ATCC 25650 / DSM 13394 / JCM 20685 / NBRC 16684 / NCIMB 2208 / IAM 12614 / B1) TaxID=384765 RepID=A0NUB5_ROSAI|nr:HlyD family secretion protein [Roseibium aggregatum]EAV43517.1 hypothetical protein SIAM614_02531 [Stappia aggregata IAM 12614] [Roseibium aggregatum IAM 12614]
MTRFSKYLLTLLVVAIALGAVGYKYRDYVLNPWTRNGQVRANVIQVAPRVSGPIIELSITDNQFVTAGDLLFRIDPRTYEAQYARARAELDRTQSDLVALARQVEAAQASVRQYEVAITAAESEVKATRANRTASERTLERSRILMERGDTSQAQFDTAEREYLVNLATEQKAEAALLSARSALTQATATLAQAEAQLGAPGEENALLRSAKADLEQARLELEFTEVRASVDGMVTNLQPRIGSQVVANQPIMALIDSGSFWIDAYFRETQLERMRAGNQAFVTLMSYPDTIIEASVDSIGWGIAKQDGSTSQNLLPSVSPTFEWIRLAQRIPVRIRLDAVPDTVELRVGSTASVLVRTQEQAGTPPPTPSLLQ